MTTTEESSKYNFLDQMSVTEILQGINNEDKTVAFSVEKAIPQIEKLVNKIVEKLSGNGRLFYIGAGTSGRLGVVDASECPPTFGVKHDKVIGIIAGGDQAIRKAVEFAEDDLEQAWKDLSSYQINNQDVLVGIAASGRTPYVIGGLKTAKENGIFTGAISCNANSAISQVADVAVEVVVGPEFLTGSTRMKSGTAQKLVLNMITTSVMIKLGHVKGNKMIDMQLSNHKLIARAIKMICDELSDISETEAAQLLEKYGSVRAVIENYKI